MARLEKIEIKKWGNSFTTTDSNVPELTSVHKAQKDKHYELTKNDASDMFNNKGINLKKLKIAFGNKVKVRLPDWFLKSYARMPEAYILYNVLYTIYGNTLYINYYDKIKKVGAFTLEDIE